MATVAGENGKIYVITGGDTDCHAATTNEEYDPATDTWRSRAPIPTARWSPGAAELNGLIYVVGGSTGCGWSFTNVNEAYDPSTNSWHTLSSMPTSRETHALVAANGKLYAIGGVLTSNAVATDIVEEYDPVSDSWRSRASLPMTLFAMTATAVDGKIYVTGGVQYDVVGSPWLGATYVYNPQTDQWTTVASMPTPRSSLSSVATDGLFYAIGGGDPTVLDTVESYNPVANTWVKEASLNKPRLGLGAATTAATNGRLFAIGGAQADAAYSSMNVVEEAIFAPGSQPSVYSVTGHLSDSNGNPLSNTVIANSIGTNVTSNASGNYLFANMVSGTYILTPTLSGYTFSPPARTITIPPSATSQNFVATRQTFSVSGYVTDNSNAPIANVSLSVGMTTSATTNGSGYYSINSLVASTYSVTPSLSGYNFTPASRIVSVGPNATNINFVGAVPISKSLTLMVDSGVDRIQLNWSPSDSPNVSAYRVSRSISPTLSQFIEIGTTSDLHMFDTAAGLVAGNTYCYRVEALADTVTINTSNTGCAAFGRLNLWVPDTYAAEGTTVIVPVNVRNATGLNIVSADIWLDFDPNILSCQSVTNTAMTTDFIWAVNRDNTNGRVRISTISSPAKTIYGDGSLFWLTFQIKGQTGSSSKLDLREFVALVGGSSLQSLGVDTFPVDVPLTLADGTLHVQPLGMLGDVNNNGVVSAVDAYLALQMAAGQITPNAQQRYSADVNGDNAVTSADVSMILYYAVNGDWPLPPAATMAAARSSVHAATSGTTGLSLEDSSGIQGGTVTIQLWADNLVNWAGGDWTLTYDTGVVSGVKSVTGIGLGGGALIAYHDDGAGMLKVSATRNTPVSGNGYLIAVTLRLSNHPAQRTSPVAMAEARLSDPYGRDYALSALQRTVERHNAKVVLLWPVFLPLVSR